MYTCTLLPNCFSLKKIPISQLNRKLSQYFYVSTNTYNINVDLVKIYFKTDIDKFTSFTKSENYVCGEKLVGKQYT